MADQLIAGIPPVFDGNGAIAAGGSVTFYETGTTTKVDIWSDVAGSVPLANPVSLDAHGRPPAQIFYTGTVAVKELIADASGVELYTVDPSLRFATVTSAAASITYPPRESNAGTNVQEAIDNVSDAVAAAAVIEWVAEATYTTGDEVFSPTDFQTYRSKTDHTGQTTDPSADATNWASRTLSAADVSDLIEQSLALTIAMQG